MTVRFISHLQRQVREMTIGDEKYGELQVVTDDGELIISITDQDVIEKAGYKAVCIPAGD